MSDEQRQRISALNDGELDKPGTVRVAAELARDSDLRSTLGRYQLIRDVLQNNYGCREDHQLAARVSAALEQEPTVLAPRDSRWRDALFKPAAGLAVAASVAGLALLAIHNINTAEEPSTVIAAPSDAEYIRIEQPPIAVASQQEERNQQLEQYLVNHNEYSPSSGIHGVLPYVHIVGHEKKE